MKKFIHFLISITVFIQIFPVFASADALYDEPNDTLFFRQWYYDAAKAYVYRNNDITGKGVKVGVIDSGLTKNFKTFHDFEDIDIQTGINVCALLDNNEEKLYDTEDSGHHGTDVTSVICAKTDNNYGIAGLTDGCTVIPYKVEDFECSSFANSGYSLIAAIELAYRDGCDIVNISRAGTLSDDQSELENYIVNRAIQNGMIIIAGTGNDGKKENPLSYPAACDNVIGVGGLEPNCEKEEVDIDLEETVGKDLKYDVFTKETIKNLADNDYSKYISSTANESVFVSAPGTNITLPCLTERETQEWTSGSGTSFAAPIVASAAIGAKQMRPYIDVDMFKEILIATSTDLDEEGYDINTGYGMVNFEKIYEYVSQMPLTAPERTPNVQVDYENGKLTNFCPNREYTVNGVSIGTPEYDDSILGIEKNIGGNIDIPEEWYGTTVEIVKLASSDAYTDSEPQLLEIPARAKEPQYEIIEQGNGYTKIKFLTDCEYKNENDTLVSRGYANNTVTLSSGNWSFWTPKTDTLMASKVISVFVDEPEITDEYLAQAQNALNSLYIKGYTYTSGGEKVYKYGNGYTRFYGCDDKFDYIVNGTQIKNNDNVAQDMFGTTVTVSIKGTDLTREIYIPTVEEYETGMELPAPIATPTPAPSAEPTATPTAEPTPTPTVRPTATAAPTATPTVAPTAEPTSVPTIAATPTPEPTATPTTAPTAEPTATPEVEATTAPTAVPTATPTTAPTENPIISFLPTIDYKNGRIIGLDRAREYTVNGKDITVCAYSSGEIGFDIDNLWYGTTITVAVKGTDEVRTIKIEFPDKQYELETAIEYKNGICTYSAVNNTIWTINATGIIAVYGQNGVLKHLETVDEFHVGETIKTLNFALSEGDTVKWLVWDSLNGMKPMDKVKLDKYIVK